MTDVLPMLAGRAAAHLDIKQPDCAEEVAGLAAGILGPADPGWRPGWAPGPDT